MTSGHPLPETINLGYKYRYIFTTVSRKIYSRRHSRLHDHIVALDFSVKILGQSRPVAGIHQKWDGRCCERRFEGHELIDGNGLEGWATQDQIEIAPRMAVAIDPAAIGPHYNAGQVFLQQALELLSMPRQQVQTLSSHRPLQVDGHGRHF